MIDIKSAGVNSCATFFISLGGSSSGLHAFVVSWIMVVFLHLLYLY